MCFSISPTHLRIGENQNKAPFEHLTHSHTHTLSHTLKKIKIKHHSSNRELWLSLFFPYIFHFLYITPKFLFHESNELDEAYLWVAIPCTNEKRRSQFYTNGKRMLEDPYSNQSLIRAYPPHIPLY